MQCMDQSNRVADQLDCGVKEWVDGSNVPHATAWNLRIYLCRQIDTV